METFDLRFLNNLSKYQSIIGELIIFIGLIMYPLNKNVNELHFLDKREKNRLLSINN